jgi:hypothetical protein
MGDDVVTLPPNEFAQPADTLFEPDIPPTTFDLHAVATKGSTNCARDAPEVKKRGRKRTEVDPQKISQRETYYQNRKRREEENKRQRKEDELKKSVYKETLGDMVEINRTDNVFVNEAFDSARLHYCDFLKTCQEHTDRQRLRIEKLLDMYYKLHQTHEAYKTMHLKKISDIRSSASEMTAKHLNQTMRTVQELNATKKERDEMTSMYDQVKRERDEFERSLDHANRELKLLQCDKVAFASMDLKSLNRLQMKWNERLIAINAAVASQITERTTCPVCMENLIDSPDNFSLCSIANCGHNVCRECFNSLHHKQCPTCRKPIDGSMLAPIRV